MFLLDTVALSGLRRPDKGNPGLLAWAVEATPEEMFISAITVFEVEAGVRLALQKDVLKGEMLRHWVERKVLPEFSGRVLPVDSEVARRCAALHVPTTRPMRDSLIAATALVHRLTVVTRNVRDFEPMGVKVLNPWVEGF